MESVRSPSGEGASEPFVAARPWLHWAAIVVIVALASTFVSFIDPKPGVNLARGAGVTASSNDGTLASAKGAADGDIWNVGVRTQREDNPWLVLDLGSEKRVGRLVIYNCYDRYPYPAIRPSRDPSRDAWEAELRYRCRQDEEIPLALEFSRDGRHYGEVARQTERFELWEVPVAPQLARYVRIHLLREGHLQLREIEVYQ